MEFWAIVLVAIGPMLLVGGCIIWWRSSAYLTPKEHIDETLRRYEQEMHSAHVDTIMKAFQIRKEYGDDHSTGSGP
jgi:hypothetical protein